MKIEIAKPQDMEGLYLRATKDAKEHGIQFTGDLTKGYGTGFGFEGKYSVGADFITITVIKKPLLVSKGRIEDEVRRYVKGLPK